MEHNDFDQMMECWLRRQETKRTSGGEGTDWAIKAGITDGTRPLTFVTREEAAQMIYRALEYFFGQIVSMLGGEQNDQ